MKKLLIVLLALAMLTSSALAEALPVDMDFTAMGAQAAIDALYDMLDSPEENQGKTAAIHGTAYCLEGFDDEGTTYFLTVADPSGFCCGGFQIEFVPGLLPAGLSAFALDDMEVTVTGTLDFGDDEGYLDVRLLDAAVTLPVI